MYHSHECVYDVFLVSQPATPELMNIHKKNIMMFFATSKQMWGMLKRGEIRKADMSRCRLLLNYYDGKCVIARFSMKNS